MWQQYNIIWTARPTRRLLNCWDQCNFLQDDRWWLLQWQWRYFVYVLLFTYFMLYNIQHYRTLCTVFVMYCDFCLFPNGTTYMETYVCVNRTLNYIQYNVINSHSSGMTILLPRDSERRVCTYRISNLVISKTQELYAPVISTRYPPPMCFSYFC